MICTRPDIDFTVTQLAKAVQSPHIHHLQAAKRLLRYLHGTWNYGLTYTRSSAGPREHGYSDADWAGCPDTRRSTSGYAFFIGGAATSWKSKLQTQVATASGIAELYALFEAVKEGMWYMKFLKSLLPKRGTNGL